MGKTTLAKKFAPKSSPFKVQTQTAEVNLQLVDKQTRIQYNCVSRLMKEYKLYQNDLQNLTTAQSTAEVNDNAESEDDKEYRKKLKRQQIEETQAVMASILCKLSDCIRNLENCLKSAASSVTGEENSEFSKISTYVEQSKQFLAVNQ